MDEEGLSSPTPMIVPFNYMEVLETLAAQLELTGEICEITRTNSPPPPKILSHVGIDWGSARGIF